MRDSDCARVPIVDRWELLPPSRLPLSGLPRLYGIRGDNIPGDTYLKADQKRAARWHARLDALTPQGFRRIGIVWAGRPTHNNDFNRSIALSQLSPLAKLDKTALISLQKGPAQSQIGTYFGAAPLLNIGPELRDYEDTMAVLDGLDLRGHGGHLGRAPRRRDGQTRLGHAALCTGLALACRAWRYAVVSVVPVLPPAQPGAMAADHRRNHRFAAGHADVESGCPCGGGVIAPCRELSLPHVTRMQCRPGSGSVLRLATP